MYHALALEDLLDLVNLLQARAPGQRGRALLPALRERTAAMLHWLRAMSHPDGGIAFFNDAAHGIAPDNAELEAYAARLGIAAPPLADGLTDLHASGYARACSAARRWRCWTWHRWGPTTCSAMPMPTLAFELSLHGRRLVVNGGTSRYGLGPERLRERGTAPTARCSSAARLLRGVERLPRRPARAHRAARGRRLGACAAHDGWRTLPGAPRHQRRWRLHADGLEVIDAGAARERAAAGGGALPPGPGADAAAAGCLPLERARRPAAAGERCGAARRARASSTHAPRFGQRLAAQCWRSR